LTPSGPIRIPLFIGAGRGSEPDAALSVSGAVVALWRTTLPTIERCVPGGGASLGWIGS